MVKPSIPNTSRIWLIVAIALALLQCAFYLHTIRDGHEWGDDWAMYILHAKNLAEGIDYQKTGFIFNPDRPGYAPASYPPVFPLLLSPIYKYFGLNLVAFKAEIVILYHITLLLIFFLFRSELSPPYLPIGLLLVLGLNPFFWSFKDLVYSEIPFMFFLYLSFLLMDRINNKNRLKNSLTIWGTALGATIYLVYGTRTVGIVLILVMPIYDIVTRRKFTSVTVTASLTFFLLMAMQSILIKGEGTNSYFSAFAFLSIDTVLSHIINYPKALVEFWNNGFERISGVAWSFRFGLYCVTAMLAVVGFFRRLTNNFTVIEIFLSLYCAVAIVWPPQMGIRLLVPIIPLYIFYAFLGFSTVFRSDPVKNAALALFLVAISCSYALRYSTLDFGPIVDSGIDKTESKDVFQFVREHTDEHAVLITAKPRVFSLLTGRPAAIYHFPKDDESLLKYFSAINVSYVIRGLDWQTATTDDSYLDPFIQRNTARFERVYANSDFEVYKLESDPNPNIPTGQRMGTSQRSLEILGK